ncbi:MAG: sigma 54-interacting transcriptional regulator, partial [Candidatus Zixiibacteriota bacterium]
ADRDKKGLFKEADGGTIFLDEIGDAPLSTQVAILRVLETGEIRPVGATKTDFVNVRIISATNKNLNDEIEHGNFRRDLYYRLNTFTVEMPPLSRRREDIQLLVHHFIRKLKVKLGRDDLAVSPAALDTLVRYSWPGNVRQLENELERAAVLSDADGMIDITDLSAEVLGAVSGDIGRGSPGGQLRDIIEKVEREVITATLKETGGNILRTSKILGLTRKGLKDKISRYGIASDN